MDKNKIVPSNYKFHSVTNLYKAVSEADINLQIFEYGSDALEVKLINTNYKKQRTTFLVHFISLNLCLITYAMLLLFKTFHILNIDIFLILWLMLLSRRSSQLVESEKFVFCYGFGIHMQVKKFWGNHYRFVPASNIHDIVINEVLEDLDFRYLLILRTKGVLFNKNPIMCIFTILRPSYECLSLIYKHLNKIIVKKKPTSISYSLQ